MPSLSTSSSEAEVVFDTSNLPRRLPILSSSTCSSPSSTLGSVIEGRCRGDGIQESCEMMENDEGGTFESSRSFVSIGLPACTSLAIRVAGDIPVGLAWRAAETMLVLAAEDIDVVLRETERTEFAEEPGALLVRMEGLVCTLQLSAHCSPYRCPWRCGDGWKSA